MNTWQTIEPRIQRRTDRTGKVKHRVRWKGEIIRCGTLRLARAILRIVSDDDLKRAAFGLVKGIIKPDQRRNNK